MNSYRKLLVLPLLASLPLSLPAQFFDPFLATELAKFQVTIAYRHTTGISVDFSGTIGEIPSALAIPPLTGTEENRTYVDGAVFVDEERNPGGRTTLWRYEFPEQRGDGTLSFNIYSASSATDAELNGRTSASQGMELQFQRYVGRIGESVRVGGLFGFSINSLNSNIFQTVAADLVTLRDVYDTFGEEIPNPPFSTSFLPVGEGADPIPAIGSEPILRTITVSPGEAIVDGNWRIKGAFYNLRLGPTFQVLLGERFFMNFGAGAALIYSAAEFSINETFFTEQGQALFLNAEETAGKWLPGYYADTSFSYRMGNVTSLTAGIQFQANDSYSQRLENRVSRINMDSSLSFILGLTTRF